MLTQSQFNQFWLEFRAKFPPAAEYVEKLETPSAYLDGIYQSMAAFDEGILNEMLALMLSGEIEPVPNTQLGHLGSEIRKRCREVCDLRRRKAQQDWQDVDEPDQYRAGPTMKDGAYVARCFRCMDYGWVSVASPATLKQAWKYDPATDEPKFIVGITSLPCYCDRGAKLAEGCRRQGKEIASLTPKAHEKHAIFFMDGPDGILDRSLAVLTEHPEMDLIQSRRVVLHQALEAFDAGKQPQRFDFPGY